jgi:hypothetical protein
MGMRAGCVTRAIEATDSETGSGAAAFAGAIGKRHRVK